MNSKLETQRCLRRISWSPIVLLVGFITQTVFADTHEPAELGRVPVEADAVLDHSGNGNHLRTFAIGTSPMYVDDVPFDPVPQNGENNTRSLRFSPNQDIYTSGKPINTHEFDEWTIEVSFKAFSPGVGDQGILGKDGEPLPGFGTSPISLRLLEEFDGELEFGMMDNSSVHRFVYTDAPQAGEWYSVAVTATATELKLFVKGPGDSDYVERDSATINGAFPGPEVYQNIDGEDFDRTWTIGRGMWDGNFIFFDGQIDEVRISEAALSPSEFLGSDGDSEAVLESTVAYWRFEEEGVLIEHRWIADTDDFEDGSNWQHGIVPGEGQWAIVDNGGTAQWNSSEDHVIGELRPGWSGPGGMEISGGGTFTNTGWVRVGVDSGAGNVGSLTLSGNGTVLENTGGGNTRIGDGAPDSTGVMTIEEGATYNHSSSGNFWLGGTDASNEGTLNLNGGSLNKTAGLNLIVGDFGNGTFNHNSGALTMNAGALWVGAAGGSGTYNFYQGSIDLGSIMHVGTGQGTGVMNMEGGVLNTSIEIWVGQGAGSTGTLNFSGGELNTSHWFVVGRQGATGTLAMTGGVINHTSTIGQFRVAAPGPGVGTFQMAGGVVNIEHNNLDIGMGGVASGEVTISGDAEMNIFEGIVEMAATEDTSAVLNLDGGFLRTGRILGGAGSSTVNLNGTLIRATRSETDFLGNITDVGIGEGGFHFDSGEFDVIIEGDLSGSGGLTKEGSGSLRLPGASSYQGSTEVLEGLLALSTASELVGDVNVADEAALAVDVSAQNGTLALGSFSLGESTEITIDFSRVSEIDAAVLSVDSLALEGTVIVNVVGGVPGIGGFPLIDYINRSGGGAFELGTLPPGVEASLDDDADGKVLNINVSSAIDLVWDGTVNGVWDIESTANWIDAITDQASEYIDGVPVLFNDLAAGTTDIELNATVSPARVIFDHGNEDEGAIETYTLSGAGGIAGGAGLTKRGGGTLVIETVNSYTGPTEIHGGVLSVNAFPDGGEAGPIGASSAAPENLLLGGGSLLRYTGTGASSNRGFTIGSGINTIDTPNGNLALGGAVAIGESGERRFLKTGSGALRLVSPGENFLGQSGTNPTVEVREGAIEFDGGENQITFVNGMIWAGQGAESDGTVRVHSGELSLTSNLVIGREQGVGFGELTGGVLNVNGNVIVGNHSGSNGTFVQSGGTANFLGEFWIGEAGADGTYTLSAGAINASRWFVIGRGGSGSFEMTGGSIHQDAVGENFNVAPRGSSVSTFDQSGGTVVVEFANFNVGIFDQAVGVVTFSDEADFRVEQGILQIGVNAETQGTVNLDGGLFKTGQIVGGAGTSILNMNGGELLASRDNVSFITGLDEANIEAGGLNLNTGGFALTTSQDFSGSGAVSVSGGGSVTLNGNLPDISGLDLVDGATLRGVGEIGATVGVSADATLAPGDSFGVLTVEGADIEGALRIEIDGAETGFLNVAGSLDIGDATLVIAGLGDGIFTGEVYEIAEYNNLIGEFQSVVLPAGYGYEIDYNAQGQNRIAIMFAEAPVGGIEDWRLLHFETAENAGHAADGADPDGDGVRNLLEYALGTDPNVPGAAFGDPEDGGFRFGRNGGFLELTFSHIADPALAYHIEASSAPGTGWEVVETLTFSVEGVTTYTDTVPISDNPTRFLRLRIERVDD